MPSFLTWPTSSGIRLAPSRREYSLWVWRWTNGISVVDHESVSFNPPLTSPVSTRALDSRGALGDKVPRRVGKSGPGGEDLRFERAGSIRTRSESTGRWSDCQKPLPYLILLRSTRFSRCPVLPAFTTGGVVGKCEIRALSFLCSMEPSWPAAATPRARASSLPWTALRRAPGPSRLVNTRFSIRTRSGPASGFRRRARVGRSICISPSQLPARRRRMESLPPIC